MLRQFLDSFGFDYEFLASSDCYRGGRFDETLRATLRNFDAIMDVMLPTLREERRKTYSPILPISARSGKVLQVPVEVLDVESGLIAFEEDGERTEQTILSGGAKLQWKVDWAMRWVALGVDYEMSGKDLIDSVTQSSKIARILGARPPEGFNYELFLDENGEKISKSRGNGVTMDEWLLYAPQESLTFYIYREPRKAKQLSFGIIPKAVDEYYQFLAAYPAQEVDKKLGNPVHHIHGGEVPSARLPISFALLLNLASLPGVGDRETIWAFLRRYDPRLDPVAEPQLDRLVDHAVAYARDFVAPGLRRRPPTPEEADALRELDALLQQDDGTGREGEEPASVLQNHIYEIGKRRYGKERLRDWFKALYETLLGSEQGPRMGSFIALYGVENSRKLIAQALASA
jgi:lysyl-tRNA synthetase class 1